MKSPAEPPALSTWVIFTPFVTLNDPQLRKTIYKLHLYTDPAGSINTTVNLK